LQTTLNIKNIRSRLDRWELTHLRELAASLKNSLDAAELRAAEAEARAESWMEHAEVLRDDLTVLAQETGAQIGLSKDGTISILSSDNSPPNPGQYWPAQGGIYLGIAPAEGDLPMRHLVALNTDTPAKANWANAIKLASAPGNGARLGTQLEMMIAYTVAKAAFKARTYWTSTQNSSYGAFAQDFEDGYSGWGFKSLEFLVVPVRGLSLHDFTPLPAQPVEKKAGSEQVAA